MPDGGRCSTVTIVPHGRSSSAIAGRGSRALATVCWRRSTGTVERRQHTVASALDPRPAMALDDLPCGTIVTVEHLPPSGIAELHRLLSRSGNVRKQYCRKHPLSHVRY